MITLSVPRINDGQPDFETLFSLWSQSCGYLEDIRFDLSHCTFLRPNAVAFLGGLARLIESRLGTAVFDWETVHDSALRMNLCQNGFAGTFGYHSSAWTGNSIPYREDSTIDDTGIMEYLTTSWLGRGWVNVSPRLRDAIVGKMWEIYCNAFEHAGSDPGVFSCGQHFPKNNELVLSVVDFGQGIAANVRNFLRTDPRAGNLTAAGCLKWAFQRGNTTRPNGIARGLGLDLLKEFIRLNNGKLEVYSNEGYARIDSKGEYYENLTSSFEGTIFHIALVCNEVHYRLVGEGGEETPF